VLQIDSEGFLYEDMLLIGLLQLQNVCFLLINLVRLHAVLHYLSVIAPFKIRYVFLLNFNFLLQAVNPHIKHFDFSLFTLHLQSQIIY
jgi:hypothetical protein